MIKPLNSYVLVKPEPLEEKTTGGLYMPQGSNANAIDILRKGTVLAISDKAKDVVAVDNCVLFNKHAFTKVPNSDDVLVRLEDLYGICNDQ